MLKGVISIFSGNLIGKIIGVAREILLTYLYGTGAIIGAFRIAQSSALVTVNFFTSEILNSGFIPLYRIYENESQEKANDLFWSLNSVLSIFSCIITFLLYFFASEVVTSIAPGIGIDVQNIAVDFLKVLAFSIPCYVLSILYANLAIAKNFFRLMSIRPTIQSAGLMLGAFLAFYFDNYVLIAWGFTASYAIFFTYSLYFLNKKKLLSKGHWWSKKILLSFWKVIKPLLLLPFFLQGNIVVEKVVASYMGIEVLAAVEVAKFVTETGMVLLAIPIGYVGLSAMSGFSKEDTSSFLRKVIPFVLLITVPATCFIMIYSSDMISLLFKRGAFLQDSVELTGSILFGLSIGFWAQVISYILIKAMNANMENKRVFYYMIVALASNTLFNLIFYKYLGPITIGLGVSLYALILLILSLSYYNLFLTTLKKFTSLALCGYIYYLLDFYILQSTHFFIAIVIFAIYWLALFMFVPSYHYQIKIMIKNVLRKNCEK
jgi:putative peptidoglycan lipid II flippase